jgi:hypothetical protein
VNTFWAIVCNAFVLGGAVMGAVLGKFMYDAAGMRVAARQRR